jgi:hypothetical protein
MSYTANTILIRPGSVASGPEELLRDLGHEILQKVSDLPFGKAVGTAGLIWIGSLGECTIIEGYAAWDLFVDMPTKFKTALFRRFPDSDIAALTQQSTVEHWGFAYYRKGVLIRCQHGAEPMVVRDFGALLPLEESYLVARQSVLSENKFALRPEDPAREVIATGFRSDIVWEIFKSFTGYAPNEKGIYHAIGSAFEVSDPESTEAYNALYDQALKPVAPPPLNSIDPQSGKSWLSRLLSRIR